MTELLSANNIEDFEAFNAAHPYGHFMQSGEWAAIKAGWRRRVLVTRDERGAIKGGISVLIRKLPALPFTLMYGNRGPVADPADVQALAELREGLRALAKQERAYLFMAEPAVSRETAGYLAGLTQAGFALAKATRGATAIQPSAVYRLRLTGKTEEEIMAGFHRKHRYAVKQAVKFGVEVKVCGQEALDEFMRIMHITGERQGISVRPRAYYARILEVMGERARIYMAYYEGQAISCALNIWYGNKMWYLYAGSDNAHRDVQPNYLLQWEMIRWALSLGLDLYDFGGVAVGDERLEGLNHFKKHFGGDLWEFPGAIEVVYKPLVKRLYELVMALKYRLSHRGNSHGGQ